MRLLVCCLTVAMLACPVVGHELSVYTVIVNSEGVYPAHIPDESLKEGDDAWFWMKDSTNNTTVVIELEKGGASVRSPYLQYSCELDENGTLVDENCKTRYDHTFNQHNSAGLWNITVLKYLDGTLQTMINGTVCIEVDNHEGAPVDLVCTQSDTIEETSTGYTTKEILAVSIAMIATIGLFVTLASMKGNTDPESAPSKSTPSVESSPDE